MFIPGQKVICINDCFHRSIVEWADYIPQKGGIYTVKRVVPSAPEAVTQKPGPGLLLEELPNPGDPVCFSAWQFEPYDEAEIERAMAEAFGPDWATHAPMPKPVEHPAGCSVTRFGGLAWAAMAWFNAFD